MRQLWRNSTEPVILRPTGSAYSPLCIQFAPAKKFLCWLQYENVFNPHRPKIKSPKNKFNWLPNPRVKVPETAQ
jgi:hypothetical protein